MKRIVLGLLVFSFTFMPAFSQEFDINSFFVAQNGVFKYHIPDEEDEQTEEQSQNLKTDEVTVKEDIVSDDVTADTSGISKYDSDQEISNEDDYELEDMYGYVLHGYAEYFDDEENAISLDLPENEYLVLNIKKPVAIEGKYFGYLQSSPSLFDNNYTKYNGSEYSISPISGSSSKSVGGFSAGATYSQGIDYGELE